MLEVLLQFCAFGVACAGGGAYLLWKFMTW